MSIIQAESKQSISSIPTGSGLHPGGPELLGYMPARTVNVFRFPLAGVLLLFTFFLKAQKPADPLATPEAKRLYAGLDRLSKTHTLFGHQDALAYGVGWKSISGNSDVKIVTGDYPAVYGWDLGHLELDSLRNLDGIPFNKMREYIREGYEREGVITISWHLRNPFNLKSAWDTTHGSVGAILPGGAKHELFKSWLDKVAVFMQSLKGSDGKALPVLFRPFHEFTGNWFWWCRNVCTPEEFVALWRFTVQYLRDVKGLHQLLFVYNTAEFKDAADFLHRYPGDDVVDVLSFDMYQHGGGDKRIAFRDEARRRMTIVCQLATEKKKIAAFAETGYEAIPDASWWTETLLPTFRGLPVAWVLVWRNHGYKSWEKAMHHYAPYKGHISAADFIKFFNEPQMMFERKLRAQHIYRQ